MDWLGSNWIWLALGVGALAYFAYGRGGFGMGHGGHGHHRQGDGDQSDRPRETTASVDSADTALQPAGHAHGAPSAKEAVSATEHAGHGSASAQAEPRRHRHGC